MGWQIIQWILTIIVVEAIVEIVTSSELFYPLVDFFQKRHKRLLFGYIGKLLSCGYCLSVWVSFALAWSIPVILPNAWLDIITKIFVLHRLSNIWHEVVVRWFGRRPFVLALRKHEFIDDAMSFPLVTEEGSNEREEDN